MLIKLDTNELNRVLPTIGTKIMDYNLFCMFISILSAILGLKEVNNTFFIAAIILLSLQFFIGIFGLLINTKYFQ